jgi:hypothetical protein
MTGNFAALTVWDEGQHGSYGPGISRAKEGERTRPYTLLVRQNTARPMKVTLQARTKTDAIKFARNRWPGAAVEVAA